MGRKAKNKAAKTTANAGKTKKAKNIFKVTENKFNKKPKPVQSKLKKLKVEVNKKREQIDANFKELHQTLVVKKPQSQQQQQQQKQSIKSKKQPPINSKNVSEKLKSFKL